MGNGLVGRQVFPISWKNPLKFPHLMIVPFLRLYTLSVGLGCCLKHRVETRGSTGLRQAARQGEVGQLYGEILTQAIQHDGEETVEAWRLRWYCRSLARRF